MAILLSLCSNILRQRQTHTPESVRPVPIRILTVGKKRSRGVQLIVDEYIEKLKYYCSADDIQIRSNPKNARDVKAQVENEDTAVMGLIRPDDWGPVINYQHDINSLYRRLYYAVSSRTRLHKFKGYLFYHKKLSFTSRR
ncbi:hypothetical protein PVL29_004101 [Vitis rotundifolia]|uniref:Uncharacterized protein n=1 Tax=Vitis rotundifolia TaxID=103349 RepID=A0AA39A7A5_VITRO|nr:hypothetical protein PVL29_004101 [Vitis rotundifolia]